MAELTTREQLIQVGLERIHNVGYASTGVKEILDLAGVPKGSFYHYFPSKESFAREVLERYAAGEYSRAQRLLSDAKLPPLQRLRKYFEELIAVYGPSAQLKGCMMGNLSLEVADHSDALQHILSESFTRWQHGIAAVLREAIDRGDLAPSTSPEELAQFLLNSYEGALLRSKADRSEVPLRNFLQFAFTVLLKQ